MRYYRLDVEIYMFGFSRGTYTAHFLAQMIDHVGLLTQGNEELIRFGKLLVLEPKRMLTLNAAWRTFQKWQCRKGNTEKDKLNKK